MENHSELNSFTLFPKLPLELRLKIWKFSAPGPRTVRVKCDLKYQFEQGRMHSRLSHLAIGWSTSDPVPTILHVSHESREEALKSYQLSFGSTFHNPKIFFDFSKDTLCFGKGLEDAHLTDRNGVYLGPRTPHNYMLDSFLGSANDSEKIQSMIIDIPEDVYARRSFIWDDIRLFTGLRDLTIMPWEEDRFENELSQHYRETLWIVTQDHAEWIVPKINVVSGLSWKQWHPVRAMRMD